MFVCSGLGTDIGLVFNVVCYGLPTVHLCFKYKRRVDFVSYVGESYTTAGIIRELACRGPTTIKASLCDLEQRIKVSTL